jgi:hypothetical protein
MGKLLGAAGMSAVRIGLQWTELIVVVRLEVEGKWARTARRYLRSLAMVTGHMPQLKLSLRVLKL